MDIAENYFRQISCELISDWLKYNDDYLTEYAIAQVFSAYILGARKGTFCVLVGNRPYNNLYFEVTQSDDNRFCLDVYVKQDQVYREYGISQSL